ncbi:cytochrome c oxidase subunit III family protein, partial [Chlamydia psittaci 02DC22]
MISLLFHHPID